MPKGSLPYSGELFAGIVFLDIAGFTSITQKASQKGRYGVELVTGVINYYFERINRIIVPVGGEIFKFGGDSCLILFPGIDPDDEQVLLQVSTRISELCLVLDKRFNREYGIRFGIHGSLSRGNVRINLVGDPAQHLDYYVDGEAITRAYDLADGSTGITADLTIHEPPISLSLPVITPGKSSRSLNFLPRSVLDKLSSMRDPSELRNTAVIFLKLSPISGDSIDPADYQAFYSQIQRFVYRYEGVVNKIDYTEKGFLILIVFGDPIVHSDDIERAFICANRITQVPSQSIEVRIGINYSNIYTGIIGASKRREYGIIGNAVNIAARLMSYAGKGQICMSREIVPRIAMKFATEFVTTTTVKGIKGELEIHRLLLELPESWAQYQNRFQSLPLCLSWEKTSIMNTAIDPSGECVIQITGAPGTGKSYLIWHLCEKLRILNRDFHILSADDFTRNMRLEFFYRSIRKFIGIQSFSGQYEDLIRWAEERGIVFDHRLFYRFLQQAGSIDPSLVKNDAEIANSVMYDILAQIYKPTDSLVIDPIDCFDPESRALMLALAKRNLAEGAIVIFSSRSAQNPFTNSYFHKVTLSLEAFTTAESSVFISHYLPLVTPEARDELLRITSGNPRFLGEMLRHVREVLSGEKDMVTLQHINSLQAKGLIPDNIENLLLSTQQSLSPADRIALRSACIYGMAFSEAEITQVFGLKADRFHHSLEELIRREILTQTELEPVPIYAITNPLLRESLYRTILLSDKIHLHKTAADYYAGRYFAGESELLALAAHHYIQTGKPDLISTWSAIMAEQYRNSGSYELARRYYDLVAEHASAPEERLKARLRTIGIMLSLAENDNARRSLEECEPEIPVSGALRDDFTRAWVQYYNNVADFARMREFVTRALPVITDPVTRSRIRIDYLETLLRDNLIEQFTAEALPLYTALEKDAQVSSMNVLSGIIAQFYTNQGDYSQALKFYRQKLKLSLKLKDPVGKRIALAGMGINLSRLGKKQEAIRYYREALDTAEKSGDRNGYSKALLNIGTFLRNQGDYDGALEHYQKSLIIAKHIGNLMQESIIIYDIGELLSYQDKHDESIGYFHQSLEIAERIGDDNGKSFCYDAIGDNLFKHGQYREARTVYEQNLQLQTRINDREGIAHTYGNLGNIAKTDKDWDTARELYNKQLDILSEVGDLDGSGRAWFNLAMIDIEAGTPADAKAKLEKALELFTACDASYYIDITNQQLQSLLP